MKTKPYRLVVLAILPIIFVWIAANALSDYISENEVEQADFVASDLSSASSISKSENPSSRASESISTIHSKLNDLTGWNQVDIFDFKKESDLKSVKEIIHLIEESIGEAEDKEMKNDFTNALQAMQKGLEEKETQGFLLAHRIYHDLDIDRNNYQVKTKFRVTEWGKGSLRDTVTKYLNN